MHATNYKVKSMLQIYDITKRHSCKKIKSKHVIPNLKRTQNVVVTKLNNRSSYSQRRSRKNSTYFQSLDSNEESKLNFHFKKIITMAS